jgi:hypothetical protein
MRSDYHVAGGRIDRKMRYLIILGLAIVVTALFWPYLRQLDPNRGRDSGAGAAGTRKGGQIFFAVALCVGLSLALSVLLYLLAL